MNVMELVDILNKLDDYTPVVIEDETGKTEASCVSLFVNTKGEVVAIIE